MPEFQLQFTELFAKLRRLVRQMKSVAGESSIRCIWCLARSSCSGKAELGANLGWHMDKSSTVTLLAMLSDSNEYSGGILQHEIAELCMTRM